MPFKLVLPVVANGLGVRDVLTDEDSGGLSVGIKNPDERKDSH